MTNLSSNRISSHSKYYQGLGYRGYNVKLATLGSLGDPYYATNKPTINSQVEWQHWPSLEYTDIYRTVTKEGPWAVHPYIGPIFGEWANIQGISIAFRRERAPR